MPPHSKSTRRKRKSFFRFRPAVILGFLMALSAALAIYNVRMSHTLMKLEQQIKDCVQYSNNQSSAEAQRVWVSFGQEYDKQVSIPDETQNRVDERTRATAEIPKDLLPLIDWNKTLPNTNIDIGVPVSGQDSKLVEFFGFLGNSIGQFYRLREMSPTTVTVRVLVTRYSQDDSSIGFRQRLAEEAALSIEHVVFVHSAEPRFHRAPAINVLHNATKHNERSVLAIVDVDMDVGPRFLYNSLDIVGKSRFYFPIVFSEYRPSNTMLVEKFLGRQHKYSKHRGMWRVFGYGMYAISGADVSTHLLDESFQGWGGEDEEYFRRIRDTPNITLVRDKEYDLVHRWHAKYCDLGAFVEPDKLRICVKSRYFMEGSNFGQFLVRLESSNNFIFRQILASSWYLSYMVALVVESKAYEGLVAKPTLKRDAYREVVQALSARGFDSGRGLSLGKRFVSVESTSKVEGILIGVTASRATFSTRVREMVQTWAKDLPKGVFVRYYVGDLVNDDSVSYASGSAKDVASLAQQAGIVDKSTIVVMAGIKDDEYPLVQKAAGVLNHMHKDAPRLKQENEDIQWFFDVDDDTYVNVVALQNFLADRNGHEHNYLGKRGTGAKKDREMLRKGGLGKPYCLGGTGILMAKRTFQVLVDNVQECIVDANKTQDIVYDDVVFGMCLQQHVGIGCWEDSSYNSGSFSHNFHASDNFPRFWNLHKTITVHPHKTPGMMTRTHTRFVRHVYNATGWSTFLNWLLGRS